MLTVGNIDWPLLSQRLFNPAHPFWSALQATVGVAVVAQSCGVVLGLISALARRSRFWPARFLSYIYVVVIRGTPVIVQIFFTYYGANLLVGVDVFPNTLHVAGFSIGGALVAGTVALSLNEGAYMSEIIRAGISSIDVGQAEAARALGMTHGQTMRRIILPQAARVIVPPLGNEFNNMIKYTSLLSFIGVYEMFQDATTAYSTDFQPVAVFAAVAVWYLLLSLIWAVIQAAIERRLSISDRVAEEGQTWKTSVTRAFGLHREAIRR